METIGKKIVKAARTKVRFATARGPLAFEDLWDMPLEAPRANDKFSLDELAIATEAELSATASKSFVKKSTNKNAEVQLRFDLIKFVIEVKLEEAEKASKAKTKKAEKEKLLRLLAKKQDEKLEGMSEEDIQAQIAALDEE